MYLGLFIGSIFTLFIFRELYNRSQLRTSLNVLIITIFITDCIRALICAPFESYVLINTWNTAVLNCEEQVDIINSYLIILNFCRLTMSIRSCFNVIQPFGFVAIAYERLRTIVQKNGSLNLNSIRYYQQRECIRLKYAIIWICISLLLGISAGLYQGITYTLSYTCYNHSNVSSQIVLIIRLCFCLSAALISGIIYGRIFFIVKNYQNNTVTPIISIINNSIERQNNLLIDIRKKDFRIAKNTFILFLSFFLWRIPSVIIIFISLIMNKQSNTTRCYLEELTNFSVQLTFLATITDPIAYIYSQPVLKQKFIRLITFFYKNRIQNSIEH
jgi:hypothetical protein